MVCELGEVNKAWEEGRSTDGGHKECRFYGHKDICQNPLDKEQTNKANAPTVLNQLQWGKGNSSRGR